MQFTDELRNLTDALFKRIKRHPFVQGIANESLEPNQLIHYVQQDYQYLTTYVQVYGLAMAKCTNRDQMRDLHARMRIVLEEEIHPHINFCRVAQVDYRDLQTGVALAPTAHHYAKHMLSVAQSGSLGEILATLLPCHWIYIDIADDMMSRVQPNETHAFYDWIRFYSSEEMHTGLATFRDWIDAYTLNSGERERDLMREHFLTSCQLELRFFDMAYTLEDWAVRGLLV
ncbi:thiaminase II [Alicyclobacillus dauci]|uniref:Aminopyrimidine aminohydrolase n=1 Tax=Alicyclobacillus dauci TaxID=1475485 RepID=A0ABY6Z5P9_9BACL|nr:thiaminase II [Alicyclobacillus dauci]WAH37833.1 thiaminase II [Alicyclobacillus dauci]